LASSNRTSARVRGPVGRASTSALASRICACSRLRPTVRESSASTVGRVTRVAGLQSAYPSSTSQPYQLATAASRRARDDAAAPASSCIRSQASTCSRRADGGGTADASHQLSQAPTSRA
jgi:hypothetical protein